MRQKRVSCDAVEHSDEVGETPASDSGLAAVSHLGRACAEAYRGEDECSGGFGAEDRSLVWPAELSGDGAAAELLRLLRSRAEEGEGSGEGTEWSGLGARGGVPTGIRPVGRGASTTPTYGRHVAGVGWTKAGVRAREREGGETGPRCLAGPKGRQVGPAAPAPFFLKLFSQKA